VVEAVVLTILLDNQVVLVVGVQKMLAQAALETLRLEVHHKEITGGTGSGNVNNVRRWWLAVGQVVLGLTVLLAQQTTQVAQEHQTLLLA
jgi:hypothetical protein